MLPSTLKPCSVEPHGYVLESRGPRGSNSSWIRKGSRCSNIGWNRRGSRGSNRGWTIGEVLEASTEVGLKENPKVLAGDGIEVLVAPTLAGIEEVLEVPAGA